MNLALTNAIVGSLYIVLKSRGILLIKRLTKIKKGKKVRR